MMLEISERYWRVRTKDDNTSELELMGTKKVL